MASLAHFLTGLAGVNLLGDADRGVYAVFFAAFMVAAIVPQFLIFTPAEIIAVSHKEEDRLMQVLQSLRLGIVPTLIGSSAILIAALSTAGNTTRDVTIALALTSGAAVLVSPAQDHVRRLLHIGRRSWSAASVSITQFVAVVAGLGTMVVLGVPTAWVPFGALTLANVVSLSLGLFLARPPRSRGTEPALSFKQLLRSGRWLLATALVPFASSFAGTILIVKIAGPEAMGFAEAARVASQPILVLGTGLNAVLGPRGMAAAIDRNLPAARRAHHVFLALIVATGVLYLAIAGWNWVGNPMVYLVPAAYAVGGLVAVTTVAHIITAAAMQYSSELMGGRKEVELTKMSLLASPFLLIGSATAGVTASFARAIGIIMEASVRYGAYGFARGRMYREAQEPTQLEPSN
jgi:O-antigen/teichoic acid export membrane protein